MQMLAAMRGNISAPKGAQIGILGRAGRGTDAMLGGDGRGGFIEQNSAFNLTCDLFVEAIFAMLGCSPAFGFAGRTQPWRLAGCLIFAVHSRPMFCWNLSVFKPFSITFT